MMSNVRRTLDDMYQRLQQLRQTTSANNPLQAEDLLLKTVGELTKEIGDPHVGVTIHDIMQEYRRMSRLYCQQSGRMS